MSCILASYDFCIFFSFAIVRVICYHRVWENADTVKQIEAPILYPTIHQVVVSIRLSAKYAWNFAFSQPDLWKLVRDPIDVGSLVCWGSECTAWKNIKGRVDFLVLYFLIFCISIMCVFVIFILRIDFFDKLKRWIFHLTQVRQLMPIVCR